MPARNGAPEIPATKENAPVGAEASKKEKVSANKCTSPPAATQALGARPEDWDVLHLTYDRLGDIYPVACPRGLPIAPGSHLEPDAYDKVPSAINSRGQVHGFKDWPNRESTEAERQAWRRDSRLGIAIVTRETRALDGDIDDPERAAQVLDMIERELPGVPVRTRANSPRFLVAFRLKGTHAKRVLHLANNQKLEFLGTGQQFVTQGTHKSGARLEWNSEYPNFPEITEAQFESLWAKLKETFAVKESRNDSKPNRKDVLTAAMKSDPVYGLLEEQNRILKTHPDGRLDIVCPFPHTTETSDSSTSYYCRATGGYPQGGWSCLHASCEGKTTADFKTALGYVDPSSLDDFKEIAPERETLASLKTAKHDGVQWLFTLLICVGAFLIVGRPKIGKSWLLLMLACLAGRGQSFLGYAAAGEQPGLYIGAEDTRERFSSRLEKLGIDPPANVEVWSMDKFREIAMRYSDRLTLVQFLDAYLDRNPDLRFVLIDTESTCRAIWNGERSSNDNQRITTTDYNETREFDELALRRRVFIGLVNHSRKGTGGKNAGQSDPHELINRTNTALAGCSGSIVIADLPGVDPLDTEQRKRLLAVRGRDLNDDIMLVIEQDQNTAAFRSLGKYQEVRQSQGECELLEAVRELQSQGEEPDAFVPYDEVADEIAKSVNAVKQILRQMRKAKRTVWNGLRVETRKGRKGGVRLVATADADDLAIGAE